MLLRAGNEIAATIDVFKADGLEEQVENYAKAVGDVIGAIDGLLRPIVIEYPDLLR